MPSSQPAQAPAAELPANEKTSAPAEGVENGGKKGEFYRYTDENGTIHLVENPDNIPEKYRQRTKVYNSPEHTTLVRIVNNRSLCATEVR